jgi:D-alanyl-D-alanine carboxypeptidase (penicillin-binding protein 5/6)
MIILILFPFSVCALEYPKLNSKIVEVYDLTDDKVLYEIGSNKQVSIASLTKIATVITAIENIKNLDEKVTITSEILNAVDWQLKRTGLKSGEILTYRELLYATMLNSGSDSAESVAVLSSGSVENFVKKMNKLVDKLGLKKTHFVNVTGLDAQNHHSTASEVRQLLAYALKNKTFREIFGARSYTLSNGIKVTASMFKYKVSDEASKMVLGSKTGITGQAGYCLATLSKINGHEIIIITLNATSGKHVQDTVKLIEFINKNYKEEEIVTERALVKNIPVNLSDIENYEIASTKTIIKFVPIDFDKSQIKVEYEGIDELDYSNKKEDNLGKIKYYLGDSLLFEENVILNKDIKLSFSKLINKYKYFIIITFIFILFFVYIIDKRIQNIKRRKRRKKVKS